jgi:hypothetical protein
LDESSDGPPRLEQNGQGPIRQMRFSFSPVCYYPPLAVQWGFSHGRCYVSQGLIVFMSLNCVIRWIGDYFLEIISERLIQSVLRPETTIVRQIKALIITFISELPK